MKATHTKPVMPDTINGMRVSTVLIFIKTRYGVSPAVSLIDKDGRCRRVMFSDEAVGEALVRLEPSTPTGDVLGFYNVSRKSTPAALGSAIKDLPMGTNSLNIQHLKNEYRISAEHVDV